MSEEYEDDFENCHEEDFESDGELEVPNQQHAQPEPDQEDYTDGAAANSATAASQLDKRVWPSLSTSLHSPPSWGRRQAAAPAFFGKPLFADTGPVQTNNSIPSLGGDIQVTLQLPDPPKDDLQRRQAAAALQHAKQIQQEIKLHISTQLDMLVLHPLTLHQQYIQGVGVYAGRTAAACQTRQLDSDIREQDVQTDQVEQQPEMCQVPEDLYSITKQHKQQQLGVSQRHQQLPSDLLAASNPLLAEFLEWAVPQVLFELSRAEAEAAAECTLAAATAGPSFAAVQTAAACSSSSSSMGSTGKALHSSLRTLLSGELQLPCGALLAGRPVVGLAGPPTDQAAAEAASAISAAAAAFSKAAVSNHLLLACYRPVAMPADAAATEHGLAGLGCLCVWDLLQASSSSSRGVQHAAAAAAAGGSGVPFGVVQLLVSEGRPTCCCWGAGEASCLVFAGMEEGGICCWDLSEPDKAHRAPHTADVTSLGDKHLQQQQGRQQQQQGQQRQQLAGSFTPRRPSYSTEAPLFAASSNSSTSTADTAQNSSSSSSSSMTLFAGGVAAIAAVPAGSSSGYGAGSSSSGGSVCRLVVLSAGGCITIYSVMLGDAGSDIAVADLGMRTGSRVWLAKICEGLLLGMEVVKLRRTAARVNTPADAGSQARLDCTVSNTASSSSSSRSQRQQQQLCASTLMVLPGSTQQLLVGVDGGRVLKGAALGVTTPPHEYTSAQWWPGQALTGSPCDSNDTCTVSDASSTSAAQAAAAAASMQDGWCISHTAMFGAVTSLAICQVLPEAWVAGHSSGHVALFSQKRSRPCWLWQHPDGTPVVAVRWLPQTCALLALYRGNSSSSSNLVAFDLTSGLNHPAAWIVLHPQHHGSTAGASQAGESNASTPQPCCMEVLSTTSSSSVTLTSCTLGGEVCGSPAQGIRQQSSSRKGGRGATVCVSVAVGFSDGSSSVYQVDGAWSAAVEGLDADVKALQALISS